MDEPIFNHPKLATSLSSAKPSINVYPEIKVCEFVGYEPKTQLGLVITSDDYSHDVVKVNDDSPAQRAGLCKGDVILAVNGQSVENKPNAIELLNEFSETKPLRVLAASRYAYEWSKLLKIKITEKDWPNIKKFVTRNLAAQKKNEATSLHNLHRADKNLDDTPLTTKYYQTINTSMRSNMHLEDKHLDDTQLATKHYQTINTSMRSNMHLEDKHLDDTHLTAKHYQTINSSVRSNLGRSAVDITADGKVLRLCSLVLDPTSANPTDSEFGFDLVTKISGNRRIGDYLIDTVDLYSPACCSGLKPGDRLVEVDGLDVSTKTFEQVVQLINEAKQRCKLKLLVYPGMVINYANQSIIPELREEHVICNEHFNQTYTSVESARSLPDLTDHYSKNFNFRKQAHESSDALSIVRPVPRLCTIYKQSESNIGFGVQVNKTSEIVPNYVRVNIVNYKSPAYVSGLQAGDLIVEINGQNTLSMSWDEALHYVKTSYEVNNYVKLLVASEFCYNWLKDNQLLATLNSDNANTFSYADYLKRHHRYVPRLCRVRLFPFSKSFGFSIESMLIRPTNGSQATSYAHIVNRVDKESPAYASSIQKGDRIVEFDGVNVESENQQQLLDRIYQAFVNVKLICLLVVDPDTDNYFKSKCIKLHGMLPIVQHITNSTEI
ncbi:Na(+) H(+) exchange regulatory cofactor NHE-RF1 [Brachionus plicatilis]|uniref:Na(+) H(+) exchange regulatory cofactor NHE-RF1 n=1 Tax=Brachionus plicatilis TaxID=10195 RepID=A0A3M7S5C9_BRAPC|nr:Na(+) H(+) exchange regulatory cofactor NHE-RF1 [Brachionus plicatilis]